jgi:hypothetical protein
MYNAGGFQLFGGMSNVLLLALIFGGFFYFHKELGQRNSLYALLIMVAICLFFR